MCSRYPENCHGAVKSIRCGVKNASRRLRGYTVQIRLQAIRAARSRSRVNNANDRVPHSSVRAIEKWFGSPANPSDISTAGTLVTVDSRGQRAFVLERHVMDHDERHPGFGRQGFRCAVN